MKIWLSKNSQIPVRDQLTTQIILGVASGDLPIGERLPSTREVARRFGVHANTVSGAYQNLAEQGWLEFRKGSGFFVCDAKPENLENPLDKIIAEFLRNARKQGFSASEIKARLTQFFDAQTAENFLLIESDTNLRRILIEEIKQALGFEIDAVSFAEFEKAHRKSNFIFVAMFDERAKIGSVSPSNKTCVFLKARSVADSMKDQPRPTPEDLIAVVSGWEKFLSMAKTVLVAADIDPESVLILDTKQKNLKKSLNSATMIICDSLTTRNFKNDDRVRVFRLISDESLKELKYSNPF